MKKAFKLSSWLLLLAVLFMFSNTACVAQKKNKKTTEEAPPPPPPPAEKTTNAMGCEKYGADRQKTLENVSLFTEFYKQKDYVSAIPYWRYVFANAPGLQQNTYIRGEVMYKKLIEGAETDEAKQGYIDTLFLILEGRERCFGGEGALAAKKGLYLRKYYDDRGEESQELYQKAIDLEGNKVNYAILKPYFMDKYKKFRSEEQTIDRETFDAIYNQLKGVVDYNIENETKYFEKYKKYFYEGDKSINALYQQVVEVDILKGVSDCASAKEVFGTRYRENSNDITAIKNYYNALKKFDCTSDPEFLMILKKLYEVEPTADRALYIAKSFKKVENYAEAKTYYNIALEMETDNAKKSKIKFEQAMLARYKEKSYPEARRLAQEAADLQPGWGEPYLFIGEMYASSGKLCGPGTGWDSQVVVWVALDMWQKAKSVDPSVADKAQEKINKYYGYIPTVQDGFLRGVKNGDSYTVKCWIQRSTTVRLKK